MSVGLIQFQWTGFILVGCLANGLVILITWAITRAVRRKTMSWQDRADFRETIREQQSEIKTLIKQRDDAIAEAQSYLALIIANKELAHRLAQNHHGVAGAPKSARKEMQ